MPRIWYNMAQVMLSHLSQMESLPGVYVVSVVSCLLRKKTNVVARFVVLHHLSHSRTHVLTGIFC
jgi:hypothetical protein